MIFSSLFKKKGKKPESPIGMHIKQDCVFAHSEKIGDVKLMRMQSGNAYVVKLVDMDSVGINHGADDTALRNLIWEILDILELWDDPQSGDRVIRAPLYGSVVMTALGLMNAKSEEDIWSRASDEFVRLYFPEQNKGPRFLRG